MSQFQSCPISIGQNALFSRCRRKVSVLLVATAAGCFGLPARAGVAMQTIWELFPSPTIGMVPMGRLAEGADGSFYGSTEYGWQNQFGTIFKVTSAGVLTTCVN